jgi:hypothetical protein
MANYYGKSPLRMMCPHCGTRDEHPVERTDTANYYLGALRTAFFNRIAGRDISYRLRHKRCVSCHQLFSSVEMPHVFFQRLMGEVERLEGVVEKQQKIARTAGRKLLRLADGPAKRSNTKKSKP